MKKEINPEYLTCPIRQVISRFGDKWSVLVLYTLDRSQTGVMRFNELHARMSDCSQKMLSKTLKQLQASHLVGRSLIPTLEQLISWAKAHFEEVVRP